jgi:hypothetical protein
MIKLITENPLHKNKIENIMKNIHRLFNFVLLSVYMSSIFFLARGTYEAINQPRREFPLKIE